MKYPLAGFFEEYNIETTKLDILLFYVFLDLSVLQHINKIKELKMTSIENELSMNFSIDFKTKAINIQYGLDAIENRLIKFEDIEKKVISIRSKT